jgi:hypothetical protein
MKLRGRTIAVTMGSDVPRDGMYLELFYDGHEHENSIAEVFRSDRDGSMTFSAFEPEIPLEVVEWLISEGKRRLPPSS